MLSLKSIVSLSLAGLVMFSDIAEMNQALAEMDQYPLICKDDSGPGGFTSVARYIIQVHRADVCSFSRIQTFLFLLFLLKCTKYIHRFLQLSSCRTATRLWGASISICYMEVDYFPKILPE